MLCQSKNMKLGLTVKKKYANIVSHPIISKIKTKEKRYFYQTKEKLRNKKNK